MSWISRTSSPHLRIAGALAVFVYVLAESPRVSAHEHPRDTSQYDVIGPYQMTAFGGEPETIRLDGLIREFLWTHWRRHRRGTVVATRQYVEGFVRTAYFVEPDQRGPWLIVEYTDYPYAPQWRMKRFSCSDFDRVEPDRLHLPLKVIPDFTPRQPEAYLLHPACSKGKVPELW
jgi:hypothetical protein